MTLSVLGGLGLFLLGMVLLVDGLKALAGEALRRVLTRFVRGPVSGIGWGALVTALVQSSSATTLATVGFVSAGLLTFAQALGVVFGANLGTTSTGWVVSQLGFKVSLGAVAPALVCAGALLRLLGRGRGAHAGMALAGFALLFLGLDLLQAGMAGVAAHLGPGDLPGGGPGSGWPGRLALVGLGAALTVLVQSSSATMAAVLAATASGAIDLEQAAYMVVGQNLGTTPTAWIAAIGAPAAAKRTALAHVGFNLVTAAVAIGILPWLVPALAALVGAHDAREAPTALAAFHTTFNLLGVLLLLPLVHPFARAIERMVPDRVPHATRYLSGALEEVGPVALEAARRAIAEVLRGALALGRRLLLGPAPPSAAAQLGEARQALLEVQAFVQRVSRGQQGPAQVARQAAWLHATDHGLRLVAALKECVDGEVARPDRSDPVVARALGAVEAILAAGTGVLGTEGAYAGLAAAAGEASTSLAALRKRERATALELAATGALSAPEALARIDALLWLDRLAYHAWRALHHLSMSPHPDEAVRAPVP